MTKQLRTPSWSPRGDMGVEFDYVMGEKNYSLTLVAKWENDDDTTIKTIWDDTIAKAHIVANSPKNRVYFRIDTDGDSRVDSAFMYAVSEIYRWANLCSV